MNSQHSLRQARFLESQVPDYNTSRLGDVFADAARQMRETGVNPLDRGAREKDQPRIPPGRAKRGKKKPRVRLSPTNSERMNRALVELSLPAFKIHTLLWKWRGAPAKGKLPFFTLKSLVRFVRLDRNTVRKGLRELVSLGWVVRLGYNPHEKNELYRLVPIADVPKPGESVKDAAC
ncbi:hypothetical protein ES703_115680 [subsurface metagenome]